MLRSHRGRHSARAPRASFALALATVTLAMFAIACQQAPDVVATLQTLTPDASEEMPPVDQTKDGGMGTACALAPWFAGFYRVVNNDHCRIKVSDGLVALISDFGRRNPAPGESRGPLLCQSANVPFYPDDDDPSVYILCEAVCDSIRASVTMDLDRYTACKAAEMDAANASATP
jgi:hypothetical protein